MKRFIPLLLVFALPCSSGSAQDASSKNATITYLQHLQNETGGFTASVAETTPTLRATSAAIRALGYLGGKVPDKAACVQFVERCYDPNVGGFRDTPTAPFDVTSTSIGLMAIVELDLPHDRFVPDSLKYLAENAKSFEDIRLAAGALESVRATVPTRNAWLDTIVATRKADGGYGDPRSSASAAVAQLRLTGKLDHEAVILQEIRAGQLPDGGWGRAKESDLETTYRVMRCFHMLKQRPKSVEKLNEFLTRCHHFDGGYSVTPGTPSNVAGTYYATIVQHWLK